MAQAHEFARRDGEARARLRAAAGRIAKRLTVAELTDPGAVRNPVVARLRDLETMADFLDSLDDRLKELGYSAAPGREGEFAPPDGATAAAESPAAAPIPDAAPEPAPPAQRKRG